MRLSPGTQIDRYTIESVLGEGGMAVVYRAQHNQLGSLHAIKVLKVPAISIQDRLLQEGRVQAQLRHPNIVSVTDVVEVHGAPGLVMEFIPGSSLDQFLHENKLTLEQADDLAKGILAGVTAAHRAGLIHRDLKPANILLGTSANGIVPKITDFGLAKLLDHGGGTGATRSGMAMGTPAYMAPEQIESAKGVDQRADIFSLGAILYELVGGERPFQGTSTLAILNAVASGQRRPLEDLVENVPKRMTNAIAGALEVDPENRIASCADLLKIWRGEDAGANSVWDGSTVETISRIMSPSVPEPSDSETYYPPTIGALEASQPSIAPASVETDELPPPPLEEASLSAPATSASAAPLVALAGVVLVGLAFAGFLLWPGGAPEAAPPPEPLPVQPVQVEEPEPEPVEDTDVEPVETPPEPIASTEPASDTEPEPEAAPEPEEDPDRPPLTFLSVPAGATVLLDGLEVGHTPLRGYPVPKGRHKVELTLGKASKKEKIGVGKRSARTFVWTVEGDTWVEKDEPK